MMEVLCIEIKQRVLNITVLPNYTVDYIYLFLIMYAYYMLYFELINHTVTVHEIYAVL